MALEVHLGGFGRFGGQNYRERGGRVIELLVSDVFLAYIWSDADFNQEMKLEERFELCSKQALVDHDGTRLEI